MKKNRNTIRTNADKERLNYPKCNNWKQSYKSQCYSCPGWAFFYSEIKQLFKECKSSIGWHQEKLKETILKPYENHKVEVTYVILGDHT